MGLLCRGGAERHCLAGELAWQPAGKAHRSQPLPRTRQGTHSVSPGRSTSSKKEKQKKAPFCAGSQRSLFALIVFTPGVPLAGGLVQGRNERDVGGLGLHLGRKAIRWLAPKPDIRQNHPGEIFLESGVAGLHAPDLLGRGPGLSVSPKPCECAFSFPGSG